MIVKYLSMKCYITNILDNSEYDIVWKNIDINSNELKIDLKNQILNMKNNSSTNFYNLYFLYESDMI